MASFPLEPSAPWEDTHGKAGSPHSDWDPPEAGTGPASSEQRIHEGELTQRNWPMGTGLGFDGPSPSLGSTVLSHSLFKAKILHCWQSLQQSQKELENLGDCLLPCDLEVAEVRGKDRACGEADSTLGSFPSQSPSSFPSSKLARLTPPLPLCSVPTELELEGTGWRLVVGVQPRGRKQLYLPGLQSGQHSSLWAAPGWLRP